MLVSFVGRRALVNAAAIALAGCATNALRVEYARTVGSEGKAAAQASREFLAQVDIVRREANVELVAADPACHTQPAIVRQVPRISAREQRGWLCIPPGWRGDSSYKFSVLPLGPRLNPTLDLVAALSSYADALTLIVDAKPSEPLKPLLDALETARSVQALLQAAGGNTAGPVPAADDPRLKAVTGFVTLLTELSDEAGKVRSLRAVIAAHPDGAGSLIAALRADLRGWNRSRASDQLLRQTVLEAIVQRTVDRRPPASVEERRAALNSQYALADRHEASIELYGALVRVLDELQASDAALRRVLVDNPQLDAKERRRVAEINRQRLVRALDAVTALITSFRGA